MPFGVNYNVTKNIHLDDFNNHENFLLKLIISIFIVAAHKHFALYTYIYIFIFYDYSMKPVNLKKKNPRILLQENI